MRFAIPCLALACLSLACFPFADVASRRAPQAGASANHKLTADLLAAEREFWEAWKNKQPDRFASAMADEAVFFGLCGTTGKAESVAGQRDSVNSCQVASYALTNPRVIPIDASAAILLYDAEQHAVCGGQPVQPFMHGESVYALRHGRWINLLRSEVPAANRTSNPSKTSTRHKMPFSKQPKPNHVFVS